MRNEPWCVAARWRPIMTVTVWYSAMRDNDNGNSNDNGSSNNDNRRGKISAHGVLTTNRNRNMTNARVGDK